MPAIHHSQLQETIFSVPESEKRLDTFAMFGDGKSTAFVPSDRQMKQFKLEQCTILILTYFYLLFKNTNTNTNTSNSNSLIIINININMS